MCTYIQTHMYVHSNTHTIIHSQIQNTHTILHSHIHHTIYRQEQLQHPRRSQPQELHVSHDACICIYIHTYTHANVHSHEHHTIYRQEELHHPRRSRAQDLRVSIVHVCVFTYIHAHAQPNSHTGTTPFADKKNYTILEAPGHKNFVPHIVFVYVFTYIHTHANIHSHMHHITHAQHSLTHAPHHSQTTRTTPS